MTDNIRSKLTSLPALALLVVLVLLIGLLWHYQGERRTCDGLTATQAFSGDNTAVFRVVGAPSNIRREPMLDDANIIRVVPAPFTVDANLSSRVDADGIAWLRIARGEWIAVHRTDCSETYLERVTSAERTRYEPTPVPDEPTPLPQSNLPNACNILVSGFEHVFQNCVREDRDMTDWNFQYGFCLYKERVEKGRLDLQAIEDNCRGRPGDDSPQAQSAAIDGQSLDSPRDCRVQFETTTYQASTAGGKYVGKPALKISSEKCSRFYWGAAESGAVLQEVDRTEEMGGCAIQFQRREILGSMDGVQQKVHQWLYDADCDLHSVAHGNHATYLILTD